MADRIAIWVVQGLFAAVLTYTVDMARDVAKEVRQNTLNIAVINGNRFTAQDGREMQDRLLSLLPPQWLRDDIEEIKGLLRDFDARIRTIEKKVQ